MTSLIPHEEVDQGYLAAEAGQMLSENPHPLGTIRYDDWRRGWHIKNNERRACGQSSEKTQEHEGSLAADAGLSLSQNPYPCGTIRHDDWRRGWHAKNAQNRRIT